jgi:hypothetical protein
MKGCAEVGTELGLEVKPGFFPKECCDSCHEDRDEYGYEMVTLDDAEVCCAILRLLESGGKE